ncbi:hypothetical protein OIU77_015261 [Salix suchowensis]|uniref:Uncharacterized protein n=1 Tax=Salix suchowensis TaxID=1278906 RepID=A0ABQ8ZS70_9ROSI|nr:hypothetical protein OIU77_015261 [Salix suchowensis]
MKKTKKRKAAEGEEMNEKKKKRRRRILKEKVDEGEKSNDDFPEEGEWRVIVICCFLLQWRVIVNLLKSIFSSSLANTTPDEIYSLKHSLFGNWFPKN